MTRGSRSGKFSAAATVAAAAAAALIAAGPATAAVAPDPLTFALSPAPVGEMPRPYFTMSVRPGQVARDTVLISNQSGRQERLRLGLSDGTTAENSGSAFAMPTAKCAGIGCWVTGLPEFVTLAPHGVDAVRFQVTVPRQAKPRQYLAGITAELTAPPREVRLPARGRTGTRVYLVNQVTVGVALTVGELRRLDTKVTVTGVSVTRIGSLVRLSVGVRNTGQRFAKANGTLTCRENGRSPSFAVGMDTVLPGDGAELAVNAPGLQPGAWPCTISLTDGAATPVTWAGTVTVPSITQAAATVRIAQGDYVAAPPEPGIPMWAVVLIVIGGLLLFSVWALILYLRRNTRHSSAD